MRTKSCLGLLLGALLCLFTGRAAAQAGTGHCDTLGSFVKLGTAIDIPPSNCYEITDSLNTQAGAIWNREKVDLSYDFDFKVFMRWCGTADGIVFVLQSGDTNTSSTGTQGGSLNYYGSTGPLAQSLAVEFDIYCNSAFPQNDPLDNHINFAKNSEYTPLTTPVTITNPMLSNCAPRLVRIKWDHIRHHMAVFLDGDSITSYDDDIVNTIFGGNSRVTFGFTGSTGGEHALQTVCVQALYYNGGIPLAIHPRGSTHFCLPDSVQLEVTNFTNYQGYSWTPSLGLDTDIGPLVVAKPPVTTLYTLTAESVGGCPVQDTIRVVVSQPITISAGPDEAICPTIRAALTVTGAGMGGTFRWTHGAVTDTTTDSTYRPLPTVSTVYVVNAVNAAGCKATDTVRVSLRVPPLANPGPDRPFCSNAGATISVPNAGPRATYAWTPATDLSATDQPSVNANPATETRYSVVVTDSAGCLSRGAVKLTPSGPLAANASASTQDLALNVAFKIDNLQGLPLRYSWDFGDGSPLDTTAAPTHLYAKQGDYAAKLTVLFSPNCPLEVPVEALPRLFQLPNIITPNGDSQNDTFKPTVSLTGTPDVQIYNRYGRLVYEQTGYDGSWGAGDDVLPGVYFYHLTSSAGDSYNGWIEVAK